jgi:hypothetical protein
VPLTAQPPPPTLSSPPCSPCILAAAGLQRVPHLQERPGQEQEPAVPPGGPRVQPVLHHLTRGELLARVAEQRRRTCSLGPRLYQQQQQQQQQQQEQEQEQLLLLPPSSGTEPPSATPPSSPAVSCRRWRQRQRLQTRRRAACMAAVPRWPSRRSSSRRAAWQQSRPPRDDTEWHIRAPSTAGAPLCLSACFALPCLVGISSFVFSVALFASSPPLLDSSLLPARDALTRSTLH